MKIVDYKDASNKNEVYEVLKELRPHLNPGEFNRLFSESSKEGFNLVALIDNERVCCVMGYRVVHDFAHGKNIYIDDLVTRDQDRSKGYGKVMIEYAGK